MPSSFPTIAEAGAALASGKLTSAALVREALDRAADPAGEGARSFILVDAEGALAQAQASDLLRGRGIVPSPLAGIPITVKDLFDVQGQVTRAGSKLVEDVPAAQDCEIVARLRAAGAIILGRTNMTEFAYSGAGINPAFGTPGNPADRRRIPGGSSSGAAVATADGMGFAGIASDTGGSVRVPAALCGLAGFKPTQARVSRDGVYPLAPSYDSIGPIARNVADCALIDAIMAGDPAVPLESLPVRGLRLGKPTNVVLDGCDATVAKAFERALDRLRAAGASITDVRLAEFDRIEQMPGIPVPEAYFVHRKTMEHPNVGGMDQRVRRRIEAGASFLAADYIALLDERKSWQAGIRRRFDAFDAFVMPTTPIVAPLLAELAEDAAFVPANVLLLRNPRFANALGLCAASLPCHQEGELPVGLMLMGAADADRRLLAMAQGIEAVLAARQS